MVSHAAEQFLINLAIEVGTLGNIRTAQLIGELALDEIMLRDLCGSPFLTFQ